MASSSNNDVPTTPDETAAMRQSLFDEDLLNDHFRQMEDLQDEENPNLVEELYAMFFDDMSNNIMPRIRETMEKIPTNFGEVYTLLHKIKGTSSSIGANKISTKVIQMREQCAMLIKNMEGTKAAFDELVKEIEDTKSKLGAYFEAMAKSGCEEKDTPPK